MNAGFEVVLAQHCAPVLIGDKPASLFTAAVDGPVLREAIHLLAGKGIHIRQLGVAGGKRRLLVYRKDRLAQRLADPDARAILSSIGYPVFAGQARMLLHLRNRMTECGNFPHEVGVFLGYPLEDVKGFMRNNGRACKCCGTWKVYGDVQRAQKEFARYEEQRKALVHYVVNGGCLGWVCHS